MRFWDVAVSIKTSADNSAGSLCNFINNRFTIHDIVCGKWEYPALRRKIIETAQRDGPSVTIAIEEAGQQKGFIDDIIQLPELRGYTIKALRPRGDKFNRAMPWVARAEQGAVDVVQGYWNKDFFDECQAFTGDDTHEYDDRIDSVSGGYTVLTHKSEAVGMKVRL